MSSFKVPVVQLKIEPHYGADNLEIAKVGGFSSVVLKGQFKTGDYAVYIPEDSVLPGWLLDKMSLKGKLAGKDKNRVKPVRLRGEISQGLIYPTTSIDGQIGIETYGAAISGIQLGDDVARLLEIEKYEPPIPVALAGEVTNLGWKYTVNFDVENIKSQPDLFKQGDMVYVTEKLHGTCVQYGLIPDSMLLEGNDELQYVQGGYVFAASKGLGGKGLVFKNNDKNTKNLYMRILHEHNIEEKLVKLRNAMNIFNEPVYIIGEIFGKGVQDLHYGREKPDFRVFDIAIGSRPQQFVSSLDAIHLCRMIGLEYVPILYTGVYHEGLKDIYVEGKKDSLSDSHVREGVVIRESKTREGLERRMVKMINSDYLFRKGATEYN